MASTVKVLRDFFGQKLGQSLQDFAAELKQLSYDEKRELATLAAKELGVTLDDDVKPAA